MKTHVRLRLLQQIKNSSKLHRFQSTRMWHGLTDIINVFVYVYTYLISEVLDTQSSLPNCRCSLFRSYIRIDGDFLSAHIVRKTHAIRPLTYHQREKLEVAIPITTAAQSRFHCYVGLKRRGGEQWKYEATNLLSRLHLVLFRAILRPGKYKFFRVLRCAYIITSAAYLMFTYL